MSSGVRSQHDPSRIPIFAPGDRVSDAYEINALLGEGGMGQVFDATDVHLKRRVALKAAWPEIDAEYLRSEAAALAAIRHPSVPAVYAVGQHRHVDYFVMELIVGVGLDRHIERAKQANQRFTIEEALDILIGITEGLVAIHRCGVAHRDIKPSNVMLAPGNRVVLMDFGLVLPAVHADSLRDGTASGTPAYMAPESITNSLRASENHLVDIYALGIVAFEVLTGVLPFEDEEVRKVLAAHLRREAPPLASIRNDVPEPLSQLTTRLLAKETGQRPESAEEVLGELRAIRSRPSQRIPLTSFSVLIADDDALVRELVSSILTRAMPDVSIRTASTGREAIEQVRRQPPDVMLLDLQMPDMNGIEVCMYLLGTSLAERCKIVLVSAGAAESDVTLLQQLGVAHYVRKQIGFHEELVRVVRALRRAR